MATNRAWTSGELAELDNHDEVHVASLRPDGTLGSDRTIWAVRLGEEVYVRSVNGVGSAWFRATRHRHEGRIRAGAMAKDVAFVDIAAADPIEDRIDAAYAAKYRGYARSIVDHINAPAAREATLKLVPR
jgi:hypothetical protein